MDSDVKYSLWEYFQIHPPPKPFHSAEFFDAFYWTKVQIKQIQHLPEKVSSSLSSVLLFFFFNE